MQHEQCVMMDSTQHRKRICIRCTTRPGTRLSWASCRHVQTSTKSVFLKHRYWSSACWREEHCLLPLCQASSGDQTEPCFCCSQIFMWSRSYEAELSRCLRKDRQMKDKCPFPKLGDRSCPDPEDIV